MAEEFNGLSILDKIAPVSSGREAVMVAKVRGG